MNYNSKPTGRQSLGRKVKRVSDVNSMGYNVGYAPLDQNQGNVQQNLYPNLDNIPVGGFGQQPQQQPGFGQGFQPNLNQQAPYTYNNAGQNYHPQMPMQQPAQLGAMFAQPMVQDMAMQYGTQLAGAGKEMLQKEVDKWVPVTKLKYYFAVDTKYVLSKLMLLFFPFTHSDWSVKYEQDGPIQPRFEINAPDLYIPTMAYVTYVLVAGLVLGMQERFTPEQIGIVASSALAWCLVELALYSCTLYIMQVQTSLRTLDLLAYSGYKFVGTIISIILCIFFGRTGYFLGLGYFNLALAFFLVRSLKAQVLAESSSPSQSYYGPPPTSGNKRRLYFLLFVAVVQPILSWWLSFGFVNFNSGDRKSVV